MLRERRCLSLTKILVESRTRSSPWNLFARSRHIPFGSAALARPRLGKNIQYITKYLTPFLADESETAGCCQKLITGIGICWALGELQTVTTASILNYSLYFWEKKLLIYTAYNIVLVILKSFSKG